jgi:galactokinase
MTTVVITKQELAKFYREKKRLEQIVEKLKDKHRIAMGKAEDAGELVYYAQENLKEFYEATMLKWNELINATTTPKI